jgi:hypothetical protein
MKRLLTVLSVVSLGMSACGGRGPEENATVTDVPGSSWSELAAPELSSVQQEQLARAIEARDEMARTLMGELQAELEIGGPAGAVVVCRDLAPMIAAHVTDEHGLRIGRTSHRLRNPSNRPPAWALEPVTGGVDRQTILAGPGGELGVLLPIRVAPPCLTCHGDPDAIDPAVRTAISDSYPDDRATGFAEGDLRGWFWVEVPTPAALDAS